MKRRHLSAFLFLIAIVVTTMASEPFIGTLHNTKGRALKGIKVYVDNPKKTVKSDKNGEFKLEDVEPNDSIYIIYKNKIHGFAVTDRKDIMLVMGEDGRFFDKDNYVGETFTGHIVDYKGKAVRGAVVYTTDPFDYVKSNNEGKFLIDNIVETDTIHIKYDGYIHDIAMDGSKGMFIKIMRNTGRQVKRDLVNTGAGMMDAREYNGPRSVMDSRRLYETATQNILQAMTAMPGVTYVHGNSQKGTSDNISIRNSQFKPLWVLDGVQMTEPPDITVMELESIEVLADGATYGTRGAGGVVIITTKAAAFKVP